jgi:hypothetical protein
VPWRLSPIEYHLCLPIIPNIKAEGWLKSQNGQADAIIDKAANPILNNID